MKKAHVTHPELKCTFCLSILGVKKNPNGASFTQLGVITKGTVIEVCCPGLPCLKHCNVINYLPNMLLLSYHMSF